MKKCFTYAEYVITPNQKEEKALTPGCLVMLSPSTDCRNLDSAEGLEGHAVVNNYYPLAFESFSCSLIQSLLQGDVPQSKLLSAECRHYNKLEIHNK